MTWCDVVLASGQKAAVGGKTRGGEEKKQEIRKPDKREKLFMPSTLVDISDLCRVVASALGFPIA